MSATRRRVPAADVEGMDACVRSLAVAVEVAREWRIDDSVQAHLDAELEAISEQWERMRGPLPPAPEEEA